MVVETFVQGAGWAILWIIGMIAIPIILGIVSGITTLWNKSMDADDATNVAEIVFVIAFVLYWVATAIVLINTKIV